MPYLCPRIADEVLNPFQPPERPKQPPVAVPPTDPTAERIKARLVERLTTGGASEKYAAALALGAVGSRADLKVLEPLLRESGDPRIGAAQGSLRILRRSKP